MNHRKPPRPLGREAGRHDLGALARALNRRFGRARPKGFLRGKAIFRDALMERLSCSAVLAEIVVDQMHALGFLRYPGNPRRRADANLPWVIAPRPLCMS